MSNGFVLTWYGAEFDIENDTWSEMLILQMNSI